MRKAFITAVILSALPLAAGFAFTQDASAQQLPPVSYPVQAPSQTGAMQLRMAEMERQIRDLTNQVEQRDYQLRQLQKEYDAYVADTNIRIQDLESHAVPANDVVGSDAVIDNGGFETIPAAPLEATSPPQPTPVQTTTTSNPVAGTLEDPDAPFKPDANAFGTQNRQLGQINESPTATDGVVTSGQAQPSNPAKDYDQAFAYLQQSNYVDAANAFQNFIKSYPTHPLAANAKYWLGETYFAQTQYTTAAKTFARAYQEHPTGQKAPDALLKLAVTLDKMDKREDACLTLKELNSKFPSGPASIQRRSGEEQKRMECAG